MVSLIEWSREGLRDGRGLDTNILTEPSLSPSSHLLPRHPILRIADDPGSCLHGYPTVSQVSELDQRWNYRVNRSRIEANLLGSLEE